MITQDFPSIADETMKEVWEIKDSLSRRYNHDVGLLFKGLYTEQASDSENTVNLKRKNAAQRSAASRAEAQARRGWLVTGS